MNSNKVMQVFFVTLNDDMICNIVFIARFNRPVSVCMLNGLLNQSSLLEPHWNLKFRSKSHD